MNRGRRGEEVFSGPEDFKVFIALLQESAELWDVKVSAYCLMSNHYHLLIQTPQGNLSRYMRHLNGVYTQRYNRAHGCDGQLFRGRYKAILVEEDSYLLELVRYIHRNPLRAGLVEKIDQYKWSSHFGYLFLSKKWDWIYKDFILAMLATSTRQRIKLYQKFIIQKDSEEISGIFGKKKLPSVLGKTEFIDWVRSTFFANKTHKQVPDSGQLAPEIERIKEAVCQYYETEKGRLMHSERGVSNDPRNVAIYLTRVLRRDGLVNISAAFGMHGYSSASSAIDRINKRIASDKGLQKSITEIKQNIISQKSQTEI
jgi:REP element-mobilizing transposase RayT